MAYLGINPEADITINNHEYVATGGQTSFNAMYASFVEVYLNGMKLSNTDYTADNGISITLNSPATAGDIVQVNGFDSVTSGNSYTKEEIDAQFLALDTATPTLSFTTPVDENTVGTVITITNYDADATYTFGTTGDIGTVIYTSGSTATFDTIDILDDIDHIGSITCYAIKAGELKSVTASQAMTVTYVPTVADTAVTFNGATDTQTNTGYTYA